MVGDTMYLDFASSLSWKHEPLQKLRYLWRHWYFETKAGYSLFVAYHRTEGWMQRHSWKLVVLLFLSHAYEGYGITASFLGL